MSELKECRCPVCKVLLAKSSGEIEICCRGRIHRHGRLLLRYVDGKLVQRTGDEKIAK